MTTNGGDLTTDILGEPWTAETIELAPDDEGAVVATLVRRLAEHPVGRAVLHVHGFTDYFFHTEYAEWWLDRGYDFYALDLRKYGRSLRPHQTPTYAADLAEYDADIDAAWSRIVERDGHRHVTVSAHSTGGLTAALWADARQPTELAGLVLNSPWFDLQGAAWMRTPLAGLALEQLGRHRPMRVLARDVDGLYGRSLHRDHEGEWDGEWDEEYEDALANPYVAAERGYIDTVITPSNTRMNVTKALRALRTKRETLPPKKHGNIPL